MTKAITKPPRRRAGVNMAAALGCLLAAVMADRSVAFVVGGGTPGAFAGCGGRAGGTARMISSSALSPSSFSGAAAVANDALRRQSSRSRRGAALRMEIMSNPITSKQYGKADKGGGKKGNPDVNEEITVSTVITDHVQIARFSIRFSSAVYYSTWSKLQSVHAAEAGLRFLAAHTCGPVRCPLLKSPPQRRGLGVCLLYFLQPSVAQPVHVNLSVPWLKNAAQSNA